MDNRVRTINNNHDSARILVVDDAADTRLMLSLRLQREGYTILTAGGGQEAIEMVAKEGLPDLAVLDIMMPGMDGFVVADELRQMGDIPVIFLSALSDTNTKVEGLNRYAEDYVTKPFAFSELLARIRRVLMRVAPERTLEPELQIDDRLRINFSQQYAVMDDKQITLTPTENRIMNILYHNRGRVLSPGFLLSKVWDLTQRHGRIVVGACATLAQQDRTGSRQSALRSDSARTGVLSPAAQPDRSRTHTRAEYVSLSPTCVSLVSGCKALPLLTSDTHVLTIFASFLK
ncbi:MAG: response regulator transcription factor [Anaerolineales bacterium]|nr:response regulator transcription factor [Anaerolineales bacterium]